MCVCRVCVYGQLGAGGWGGGGKGGRFSRCSLARSVVTDTVSRDSRAATMLLLPQTN